MRENVFYIRGPFPFAKGIAPEMVLDAKILLELPLDLITALAHEFDSFTGFLDKDSVRKIIAHYVTNGEQVKRLSRLINALDERLRSSGESIQDLLLKIDEWRQSEENQEPTLLSDEEAKELHQRLPLIIRAFPGLKRQAKAQHLAEATGLRLEDVEIICDLRPVFDERRSRVEGMIPFTTVKVICNGIDGLPVSLETILTERQVVVLAEKAKAAIEKLKHLRELLRQNGFLIPPLDMTKQEEK